MTKKLSPGIKLIRETYRFLRKAKWTQRAMARDKNGEPTTYDSPNATCFCTYGALAKVIMKHPDKAPFLLHDYRVGEAYELLSDETKRRAHIDVVGFNDLTNTTKIDVLRLLRTVGWKHA